MGAISPKAIRRAFVVQVAGPRPDLPRYVRIRDSEEKDSEVNLRPHPLVGGFTGDYEQAVVVWNDSDPATAIRYVSHDLALRAVLVNPDSNTSTHNDLVESATYVKRIWKAASGRAGYPRPSPTPTASSPSQPRGSHATDCRYAG